MKAGVSATSSLWCNYRRESLVPFGIDTQVAVLEEETWDSFLQHLLEAKTNINTKNELLQLESTPCKSALCYSCLTSQHMTRSPRPSPSALAAKLKVTKALEQGYLSASHFLANWEAIFEARFTLCVCVFARWPTHLMLVPMLCSLFSLTMCLKFWMSSTTTFLPVTP